MPIKFNSLLEQYDVKPDKVILLRHKDKRAGRGRTPYELCRYDRPAFEIYQQIQAPRNKSKFSRANFWASFVVTDDGGTMFVGLYSAIYKGPLAVDTRNPSNDEIFSAGKHDCYDLYLDERFEEYQDKLFIEWGRGARGWVQRAEKQNKQVIELRRHDKEEKFPGFLDFREPLTRISSLQKSWVERLKEAQGVYVLVDPITKEHYVGSASGDEGFWHRWMDHAKTGHGDSIKLKNRKYSGYQVAILEVAGSGSTRDDILALEKRWMKKLQSREIGLN
jgi:hypothetical protein